MSRQPQQTLNVSASILQAKRANEQQLLRTQNVRSVGIGENAQGNEVIVVGVESNSQASSVQASIPSSIQGFSTTVRTVGDIVPQQRQTRVRPVPQGVSVAHPNVTAGTSGWMYETGDGTRYIGSNNHVLANVNQATDGDAQLQPGPADGGTSTDQIGTLAFYVPVENGVNVDLALCEMTDAQLSNTLEGVTVPIGGVVDSLGVGDTLRKTGRTTGVTSGTIDQLDVSVDVNYGGNLGTVTMNGNIMTGSMSEGGDSGSPVWKESGGSALAAGRLFAGSSSATVHSHIDNELNHLINDFDSSIQLLVEDGGGGTGNFAIDGPASLTQGTQYQWSVTNVPTDADTIEWSFGDGTTATGNTATHTYSSTGSFTITAEAIGPGGSSLAQASNSVRN